MASLYALCLCLFFLGITLLIIDIEIIVVGSTGKGMSMITSRGK